MVKIETRSTGIKIELKGDELTVSYEVAKIAEHLAKESSDFADALIFGLTHAYPKEKIIERVNTAEVAANMFNDDAVTKLIKDLLEGLKDE